MFGSLFAARNTPASQNFRSALPLVLMFPLVLAASVAHGQVDRVYPHSGNAVSGKITDISPNSVTIETGSNQQTFTVDQIQKIFFEGDPAGLTKGREFALDGQWEQAIDELRGVDIDSIKREVIQADAMYYLAKSEAQLALIGRGSTADAAKKLLAFVTAHPQSIHFYGAAKVLGNLAVSVGSFDQAAKYYSALAKSPAVEMKVESVYLTGLAKLRQGKAAEAQADFEKVLSANVQSTAASRLQTLARAGLAVALSQQGKAEEGLKLVESLIAEMGSGDSEMASRIYNAQGACLEASGDTLGAVMAYLHTHLMYSGQADAHAEALSKLVELWPKLGKPDRAAEAREELQHRYPGWG